MISSLSPEDGKAVQKERINEIIAEVNGLGEAVSALARAVSLMVNGPPEAEPSMPTVQSDRYVSDEKDWSNREHADRDWSPAPGKPGYFNDPNGILQNIKRGEVPQEVLDRFGVAKEDE